MEKIWTDLYDAAKKVQRDRNISKQVSAGCVAAAVEAVSGKIYVGVCVEKRHVQYDNKRRGRT